VSDKSLPKIGSSTLTQTLARTAARHPWRVVIAWIAAIVLAVGLVAGFLGDGLTSDAYVTNDPESLQAYDLMGQRYGRPDGPDDFVVLRSDAATANDPAFKARLASLTGDLGTAIGARNVGDGSPRRTALTGRRLPFTRNGSIHSASKKSEPTWYSRSPTMISPGSARAIKRAARLVASPITMYV